MRLAVFLLLLTACGNPLKVKPVVVDPAFVSYVKMFESNIGVSASRVSVSFKALAAPFIGECEVFGPNLSVHVDPDFWGRATEDEREELIYHELAHCAMDLDHDERIMPNGCPSSIMNSYQLDACFPRYKPYYIDELRSKRKI